MREPTLLGAGALALAFLVPVCPAQFVEPTQVLHEFLGQAAGDSFGWVSSPIPDVDGDGATDVAVTAPGHATAAPGAGRVYLFSGRRGVELWHFDGQGTNAGLASVRDTGDLDGDAIGDVIAGAPGGMPATPGRAFVLSGATGSQIRTLQFGPAADGFGTAVTGLGDVDGDQVPDLAVGAPLADFNGADSGRVYAISGATWQVLWTLDGSGAGVHFGQALADVGDNNGDGIGELAVTAANGGPLGRGEVLVYDPVTRMQRYVLQPDSFGRNFGTFFVATVGDTSADGVPDIYVGDFGDAERGRSTGKCYVFDGTSGALLWKKPGRAAGVGFGIGRGVGDTDGDGRADLIICGWLDGAGAPAAGRAEVLSGFDGSTLRVITSTTFGENFGFDAHGMGDVDGDGRPDYFVTAANNSQVGSRAGKCYLILGCEGTWTPYGSGVAGGNGRTPDLDLRGCPAPGDTFRIEVADAPPGAFGGLAAGFAPTSLPLGAGQLLVQPAVVLLHSASAAGTASQPFTVPADPRLAGLSVFYQAGYLDPAAAGGFALSRGLQATVR